MIETRRRTRATGRNQRNLVRVSTFAAADAASCSLRGAGFQSIALIAEQDGGVADDV
jgi:hypothetical protein